MTLDEIRVLLRFRDAPAEDCSTVNALLDEHIGHVADRIRELRLLEKQLKGLRALCHETRDAQHCGILNELAVTPKSTGEADAVHVRGVHKNIH